MPYTSYFSDEQSASDQWNLSFNQAKRVCEIWNDVVCPKLNGIYANALTDEAEGFFKQKTPRCDDLSTIKSYKSWDRVIFEDQFKKLVDIQRGLLLLRAFYTGGLKQKTQADYPEIWVPIKTSVGLGSAAESLAKKFNDKYCPDELMHYVHYLVKSDKPPSSMKPWVFKDNGNINLRVWYRNKKAA
jgi:hypothetical protein